MTISHPRTDDTRKRSEAEAKRIRAKRDKDGPERPATHAPESGGDIAFRVDLDRMAERVHRIATVQPDQRLDAIAELLHRAVTALEGRDLAGRTVLDRIREASRGIPAVSYEPKASKAGASSEEGDGMPTPDRANVDLMALWDDRAVICRNVPTIERQVVEMGLLRGDLLKRLRKAADAIVGVLERYPEPSRERSETQRMQLERDNVKHAPDCPSCDRVPGHACPTREIKREGYVTGHRSVCSWCEKHRDDDQENGWPELYLVEQHARGERVKVKAPDHV